MQTGLGNNRQSRAAGSSSMLTALIRNQAIAQNQLTTKANKNTVYSYITPTVFGREQSSSTNQAFSFLTSNFAGGASVSPSNNPSNVFVVDGNDAVAAGSFFILDYTSVSPPVEVGQYITFKFINTPPESDTYQAVVVITKNGTSSVASATTTTGTSLQTGSSSVGSDIQTSFQRSPSGTLTAADINGTTLTVSYATSDAILLSIQFQPLSGS